MTDIALDLDQNSSTYGDLKIVANDLVLVDGTEAILQNILQTLGMYFGEWFLNTQIGIPYYQVILVKNPNQAQINAVFLNAILNVPGATQITKYSFTVEAAIRRLRVAFTVQTTKGIVNYAGLLGLNQNGSGA